MRRGPFAFLLLAVMSCAIQNNPNRLKSLTLDFQDCGQDLNYNFIELKLQKGFTLARTKDEYGFCEYQMKFSNGAVFYLTSNIYNGSSLNYDNRLRIGVETYSKNRSIGDTLSIGGKQLDNKLWKESIIRSFTVGYLDVDDSESFEKTIQSIKLIPGDQ